VKALAAVVLAAIFFIPLGLLDGWALSVLWRWYVVPVFDIRPISVIEAFGLALFVGLLRAKRSPERDEDALEGTLAEIFFVAFMPLFFLGMGWVWLQLR
jgi:hypothetical protein